MPAKATIENGSVIPALLCSLLSAILYVNTLDCGLCFDDVSAISQNQDLRPETPWTNLIWNDFWGTPMAQEGSHKSYRPLCVATFRLNYLFHGAEPLGYHLVNMVLHSIVCYLFVLVCAQVLFPFDRVSLWTAGLSFAVHPIHTEVVAGVVGRAECLSAIFFLLCFLSYKQSLTAAKMTGRFLWLLLSMTLCLLSVLSKEQGITVVAVCLSYEFFITHKNAIKSSISLVKDGLRRGCYPSWLKGFSVNVTVLVGFLLLIMVVRVKIMKAELPVFTVHDNPAVALTTPYRQLHWLYLIFENSWLLLNPSHLCADWTMGTVPLIESVGDPRNILTLATFCLLLGLGVYSISDAKRDNQIVLFGLLLVIFPFVPASNLLFPVGFVIAERILYVPSMGYAILLATGIRKLLQIHSNAIRLIAKVGFGFIIITHCCKTLERNRDWKAAETLFLSAIHVNPRNGKLFNNLGHHYESIGNYSYAEGLFRRAVEVQSDDVGAYINLGRILNVQNRATESEEAYRHAIELMPTGKTFRVAPSHINVYFNLANLLKRNTSRYDEAFKLYKRAISMKPDFIEAYMNIGDLLLKMNRTEEAKQAFLKVIKYRPTYSDAHFNLATTYLQTAKPREAEKSFRKAITYDSNHVLSLFNLGVLLAEEKQPQGLQEAKELFDCVLKLNPKDDRACFQLGIAHSELGNIPDAINAFQKAVDITPTYRTALYNLAFLSYQMKDLERAFKNLVTLKEHHPNHANGMQLLGDCYMQKKRINAAIEAYSLCLQTNPKHITAIHNLGVAMTEKGDFAKAVELFSRALQINPDHAPSQRHLQGAKSQLQKNINQRTKNG